MAETIFAKGKLFELVHNEQPDGRIFEVARRAPGVRLIVADKDNKKLMLTREYRQELSNWDYRLPGGKVFDALDEYEEFRSTDADIELAAKQKAIEEGLEEAGVSIGSLKLFAKSTLGATVEWDLYVYEVFEWSMTKSGQKLEPGEQIEAVKWFTYAEVEKMILSGQMQEGRIALALLQWIHRNKSSGGQA